MNIEYRAHGNRSAVHLPSLRLPLTNEQTLEILFKKGFKKIETDVIALARSCIGTSKYRRGARPHEAPGIMDCSSFMKWLYGHRGISLPRRSIQQRRMGEVIPPDRMQAGDLVFVKGAFDWYDYDPQDGVGHVGIATNEGTVIHACDSKTGIIETPYERFVGKLSFRGIRRLIPHEEDVVTLEIPPTIDVESSDDIRWIVLQTLSY